MSTSTTHTALRWSNTANSWHRTTIYADGVEVATLDIEAEADEDNQSQLEARMAIHATFIVDACNAFDRLNGDRISLELQVARLKIDNANAQEDLSSARSNWELAVEAGNDVVQQLEAAKLVQQQLVAALREANDLLALVAIDLDDEADYGNGRANEIVGRIRAALAAAGAA